MNPPISPANSPIEYRAVGLVRGVYLPSSEESKSGVLLTDDGAQLKARLFKRTDKLLSKQSQPDSQLDYWTVWPHTEPEGLVVSIKYRRSFDEQQQVQLPAWKDYFSIRGVVASQNQEQGKLSICIYRNKSVEEGRQAFEIVIDGFLQDFALGQFWDFECRREGERLVVEDARLVEKEPPPPPAPLEAKSLPKKGKAKRNFPALYREDEIMSTPGKMELTIKINRFPVEVKTVTNGWKQFNVEAGGQVVSIIVRPKIFKKLENAQANYPQWVAAIAGQIGERTEKGFVLKEPKIQVFERKPKEPKEPLEATEPTQSKEAKETKEATKPQSAATTETQTNPKSPKVLRLIKAKSSEQ